MLTFAHVCKDKIALMMCVRVMLNKIKKVSKFMDLGRRLLKKKDHRKVANNQDKIPLLLLLHFLFG